MRGRRPKPSILKLLEGNPGKRAINKREPKPAANVPQCPDNFDAYAQMEWDRTLPILQRMRVLTEADGIMLANLCYTASTQRKAQDELTRTGLLIHRGSKKAPWYQINPLQKLINEQIKILDGICSHFGLSPATRSKVQTISEPDATDAKWARLLKR